MEDEQDLGEDDVGNDEYELANCLKRWYGCAGTRSWFSEPLIFRCHREKVARDHRYENVPVLDLAKECTPTTEATSIVSQLSVEPSVGRGVKPWWVDGKSGDGFENRGMRCWDVKAWVAKGQRS